MLTFSSLGLSEPLLLALNDLAHVAPTPVQVAAIVPILQGKDVRASAQTGSGKTAAFVLPLLQMLGAAKKSQAGIRVLVVVPTRELALQIGDAIKSYGRHLPRRPKTCVAVGGVAINPQMMALRGGADILVATTGRLLDLVEQNAVRLGDVETLVLDEADRLLSLGFAQDLAAIVAQLPAERQTLLFSATMPAKVLTLAEEVLRDPVRINVDAGGTPAADLLEQRAIEVDDVARARLLVHLLKTEKWARVLVFVASRAGVDQLVGKLNQASCVATALHGELSQTARNQALADFKAARTRVLVATDLAARGIDVVELPVVVNYDLPRSPSDYVHRIGRTSRAGRSGLAVSFVSAASAAHFRLIEKRNRITVRREQIAGYEPKVLTPPPGDPHGGKKGKRKSKKDKLREAAARALKSE